MGEPIVASVTVGAWARGSAGPSRARHDRAREGAQEHGLARRLREGTADVHRAAERMAMVQALLRGVADRRAYGALLRAYHAVYTALEGALAGHADHPIAGAFAVPGLARTRSLAADLDVVVGPGWAEIEATPATRAYVDRLRALAAGSPELLLAHAYTRYFGDLAGGRILGRIVGRALDLREGAGLDFYAFPALADPDACRDLLRRRLDDLAVSEAKAAALVDEARRAFALTMGLFAELEGSALRGLGRLLIRRA